MPADIPKMGQAVPHNRDTLGQRDALHVPVLLAASGHPVKAGQRVVFVRPDCTVVAPQATGEAYHGVVDPFLAADVQPGGMFIVLLNPSLVEKFSHQFEIAGFPKPEPVAEAEDDEDEYDECRNCY